MTNTKFADNITMPNGDNILLQDRLATTNIEQLETNLSNEVTRATQKENTLQASIDSAQASIDSAQTTINKLKSETFIEQQTNFGSLRIQKCGELVHCVLWYGTTPSDIETYAQVDITTTLPYKINANTLNACVMSPGYQGVVHGLVSKPTTLTFTNYSENTIVKGRGVSFELTYFTDL